MTEKNYYPFGLQHKGYNNVISSNSNSAAERFKYNSKELEESLGLNIYEMDLRQYDPAIARWTSIDPITHHSMGTYVAFDNNPIYWADPSGADAVKFVNDGSQRFIDLFNSLKQESKTWKKDDDDDKDCPECDNPDILLNFISKAGIKAGEQAAKDLIHSAENPYDPEPLLFNTSAVHIGEVMKITGTERLEYRTGMKNIIKYILAGTSDYNRYEFKQNFTLSINGKSRKFQADATINIQANSSEMNLVSYGWPVSGAGLSNGNVIKLYNDNGNFIASLSFREKVIMDGFVNKYFTSYYRTRKNELIKDYNDKK